MEAVKFLLKTVLYLHLISAVLCVLPFDFCVDVAPFQETLNISVPPAFFTNNFGRNAIPQRASTKTRKSVEYFDFVVIGSGPAGSVIANRLTENPKWKVLLLEVGDVPTNLTEIPAMANSFQMTDYNWGFVMEPQDNAGLGLVDRIMNWPRGRVLGGTSTINALIHIRGNRLDFDRWAEAGNEGWSFQEVLPYFKKSEDFLVKFQDPEYHQQGGLLGVDDVPYRSISAGAFVKSMLEFGYDYVDYNGRQQMGVSFAHGTIRRGRRSGAYNAYLEPFKNRTNLKIYTGAMVTKILINEYTKRAWGVRYDKDGEYHIAKATKEVILSAGALSSPQLLMLSGVGPRNQLEEFDIPVIQDLPVGENLYDHAVLYGITFTVNESITIPYHEISTSDQPMIDFLNGMGILTTLTGTEALGIVQTPHSSDPDPAFPDIELIYVGTSNNIDNGTVFKELVRVTDEIYDAIWAPIQGMTACTILPMLFHPKSRGYIRLQSNNPYQWPKFHGNYFTDPENDDIKTMISAVRMIQELVKMPAWQKYDAKLVEAVIPGCEAFDYDTDEYWECFLRHIATTANHQVGTCKMGPITDQEAVVGSDLRVHGIWGLRVADTSIIPRPIAAHTNIPSFMIGEKAADMIKQYWSRK